VLGRSFDPAAPNRKWIADFTYVWTAEGWLYVAAVVDLFSRRVVGWSMNAAMTAQLVTDALVMAHLADVFGGELMRLIRLLIPVQRIRLGLRLIRLSACVAAPASA
jgi:hypothetical protein